MKGINQTKSVALYGRTRELRKEINEQFKQFALKQGIPEDMILFLPERGACVPWEPIPASPVKDRARRTLGAEDEEGSAFGFLMNTTRSAESCKLIPDAGPCFGRVSRFYYNHTSMTCQKLNYGGCLGNRNNFKTERECLQTCRTVAACRLPIEAGPCKAIINLWAFDSVIGKCAAFQYSGCQGNGNKFYTQKECEEYCDVVPEGEDGLLAVPKEVYITITGFFTINILGTTRSQKCNCTSHPEAEKMRCGVVLLFAVIYLWTGATVPLNATDNVQVQENFDLNQFLGTWFSLGNGCDCRWFIEKYKEEFSISKLILSTNEQLNKLIGNYVYDRNGTCVNLTGQYEIQRSSGHFVFIPPSVFEVTADIRIIETNYHEYAFILYDRMKGINQTKSVALYGRTRKLRKEINEQFIQFALKQGIPEDMILLLPERGACVPWEPIPASPVKDRARRTLGAEDEEGSAFGFLMNTTRSAESCKLIPDAGPCFGRVSRFYYNHTSMTCQKLNYGGCLGNGNNFKTERECLQTCRTVAACRLHIEAGPCKAIINLWAFDSVIGKCAAFQYSGCQGNGNKFYTQKECEEYCDVVPEGEDGLLAVPKEVEAEKMRCGVVLLFAVTSLWTGATVPLNATDNVQVQENFDLNQFLGTWFSLGNGCDCRWFIEKYKEEFSISKLILSTNEQLNKLIGNFVYDRNGTCVNLTGQYEIQRSSGHFVFIPSSVFEVTADIRIIETNYHEYAFILYDRMKGINQTKSVALYGRTRKLRKEINEQFIQFALKQGIPEDMILLLPERGACVPWEPIPASPVKDRARRTLGAEDEEGSAFGFLMNTTRSAESCKLIPDAGPCFGRVSRFYYNHTSMTCQKLNYGGCLGNGNNFKTERECLQTCRTVAACRLPIEAGPCKAIINLWAFDSVIGKCAAFQYSGCQGNGNKFYTQKECEEYCDVVPEGEDGLLAVPKKV
ncbi:papilin-like [Cetorhinus maximus]